MLGVPLSIGPQSLGLLFEWTHCPLRSLHINFEPLRAGHAQSFTDITAKEIDDVTLLRGVAEVSPRAANS